MTNPLTPLPWMTHAACSQPHVDPDWFFNALSKGCINPDTRLALATCAACPVLNICREWTVKHDLESPVNGIWGVSGGMTQTFRQDLRRVAA